MHVHILSLINNKTVYVCLFAELRIILEAEPEKIFIGAENVGGVITSFVKPRLYTDTGDEKH